MLLEQKRKKLDGLQKCKSAFIEVHWLAFCFLLSIICLVLILLILCNQNIKVYRVWLIYYSDNRLIWFNRSGYNIDGTRFWFNLTYCKKMRMNVSYGDFHQLHSKNTFILNYFNNTKYRYINTFYTIRSAIYMLKRYIG